MTPLHLRWVIDAFWSLQGDRGGNGLGPIHFVAIDAYARRAGISEPAAFDRFERRIRSLDAAYIAFENERREAEAEKARMLNDVRNRTNAKR